MHDKLEQDPSDTKQAGFLTKNVLEMNFSYEDLSRGKWRILIYKFVLSKSTSEMRLKYQIQFAHSQEARIKIDIKAHHATYSDGLKFREFCLQV